MNSIKIRFVVTSFLTVLLISCSEKQQHKEVSINENEKKNESRIVSLDGSLSEVLCVLGKEKELVATDVTSTYPESVKALPKVGHNTNISIEGILSVKPTHVLGIDGSLKPNQTEQLTQSGIKVIFFKREYTLQGTKNFISAISDSLGIDNNNESESIYNQISKSLEQVKPFETKPKVLFIYARGAGTVLVGGKNTKIEKIIDLAGGQNAVTDIEDFKPLTTEAVVMYNPDVVLMFSSGLESLDGNSGLLEIPGISLTTAGKDTSFIAMDGQFVSGFGPRLGEAVLELNKRLHDELH